MSNRNILNKIRKRTSANLLMSFLLSCVVGWEDSHPGVVELAIAEMACVSSNVRRTFHVPSGVRVQRSISERDCSHPIVELEKSETTSIEVICTRYTIPCLYASTSTQWFIDILFITRDSRMSNKLCGRKTTKQKELTL